MRSSSRSKNIKTKTLLNKDEWWWSGVIPILKIIDPIFEEILKINGAYTVK